MTQADFKKISDTYQSAVDTYTKAKAASEASSQAETKARLAFEAAHTALITASATWANTPPVVPPGQNK